MKRHIPPPANPANSRREIPWRGLAAASWIALSAPLQGQAPPEGAPPVPGATNGVPEEIAVSFEGADINLVVQWLAKTTGKSVVKHPQAQCQLTIMSSRKLSQRSAIELVYRALSLEGFSAVESADSIFIVPEGKEPKMTPELLSSSQSEVPAGRQRLMKIFQLQHLPASEIRDRIKSSLSDKGTIELNERSNQIIVTDYNQSLSLAADLIKILDTDRPGDLTARVIPLKHVSAQDLVKEIAPLYQKSNAKPGAEPVEVSANDRSNSLIIMSSEANFRAIERIVATLDTVDAQEKVMRPFPLKNADAEDVAKQIKDLVQDQEAAGRNRYFYFDPGSQNKGGKKMSVVADRRRNTVIVQAPPGQMAGIGQMIEALDQPAGEDSLAPRIIPLKYVGAVDIEEVLNQLFLKKPPQRSYWFDEEPAESQTQDVGRLYGKVRITSEPYSNAIIVTSNSKEALQAVEDVLKQLDVASPAGESTFRIPLKFAKSTSVANNLNVLFAKGGSPPLRPQNPQPQPPNPQQQQEPNSLPNSQSAFGLAQEAKEEVYFPWLGGQPEDTRTTGGRSARQVSDLVGRVRVVPDHRSNAVLVSGNVHFFPQIMKLVEDLDTPTAQVMLEARIVEVSSDFLDKLGVRWSADGNRTFTADDMDGSFLLGSKSTYQKGFGGNTVVNTPGVGGVAAALAGIRSGVIDSSINLDFLVQFLRKNVGASVLAEPRISIEDNEVGKLFVGSQIPFISNSQNTQVGSLNQSFQYKEVGVILEVIPHININGDVSLNIRAESSSIEPGQTLFGGAILDTRNFRTEVTAKDGETLVLGGIIQKQVSDITRKTPILGSIPGLGWAFKKKDKSIRDVELLVFLRPRVIRTQEDARRAAEDVRRKTPLIEKWSEEADAAKAKAQELKAKP